MILRLLVSGLFITSAAAGAAGVSPYAWIAPIVCGALAALIVRGIAVTTPSKVRRIWTFEALVTALSVLLTGVIVEERALSLMYATVTGIGIGGMGVGVITITRTAMATVIKNIALAVLSNGATPTAEDEKASAQVAELDNLK